MKLKNGFNSLKMAFGVNRSNFLSIGDTGYSHDFQIDVRTNH